MSVGSSWGRIARWHEANTPWGYLRASPGASPDAIDDLERTIGARLPEDFRESLVLHDGGPDLWLLPTHGELLPVAGILSGWRMYCDWQRTKGYGDPRSGDWVPSNIRGPIKPFFWSPRRLYVTDNSGDHVTLDLDPPDDGSFGQVLYHSHEVGPEEILAPSWSAYLELVAGELESGRYYFNEEGCVSEKGLEE